MSDPLTLDEAIRRGIVAAIGIPGTRGVWVRDWDAHEDQLWPSWGDWRFDRACRYQGVRSPYGLEPLNLGPKTGDRLETADEHAAARAAHVELGIARAGNVRNPVKPPPRRVDG
jgi:hypothetical protein